MLNDIAAIWLINMCSLALSLLMAWMAKSCIVATVWPPVLELPVVNFVGLLLVAVVSSLSPNMLYIF